MGLYPNFNRPVACLLTTNQAWNIRPKQASSGWRLSAEFVESALIFTYGATNIFLEHLGNSGGEWSSQDLEHISITVLFIGGGLVSDLVLPELHDANPGSRSSACLWSQSVSVTY